jgi:hypothetical protein
MYNQPVYKLNFKTAPQKQVKLHLTKYQKSIFSRLQHGKIYHHIGDVIFGPVQVVDRFESDLQNLRGVGHHRFRGGFQGLKKNQIRVLFPDNHCKLKKPY